MKKILIALSVLATVACTFAQGTVTFANSTATAITNLPPGATINVGGPYPRASVTVGLYASTSLGLAQNDSSLTLQGLAGATAAPGVFSLGARQITGSTAGDVVTLQVRAWSGAYASYELALAANDPLVLRGKSIVWEQSTGGTLPGGGVIPVPGITGAGRLQPFTVTTVVPEPSSIALGLLGLSAIALFRRRK